MAETKRCPYCGEEILAVAKKCKHCGEWLDKDASTENINIAEKSSASTSPNVRAVSSNESSSKFISKKPIINKLWIIVKWFLIVVVVLFVVIAICFFVDTRRPASNVWPTSTNNSDSTMVDVQVIEAPENEYYEEESVGSSNGDGRTSQGAYIDYLESTGQ